MRRDQGLLAALVEKTRDRDLLEWAEHQEALDRRNANLAARAGKGRPAGSRTRENQAIVDLVRANGRDPLVALNEDVCQPPVEVLARRLGCTKLEALKVQMSARLGLGRFIHPMVPQAVFMKVSGDEGLPVPVVHVGQAVAQGMAASAGDLARTNPADLVIEGDAEADLDEHER